MKQKQINYLPRLAKDQKKLSVQEQKILLSFLESLGPEERAKKIISSDILRYAEAIRKDKADGRDMENDFKLAGFLCRFEFLQNKMREFSWTAGNVSQTFGVNFRELRWAYYKLKSVAK